MILVADTRFDILLEKDQPFFISPLPNKDVTEKCIHNGKPYLPEINLQYAWHLGREVLA